MGFFHPSIFCFLQNSEFTCNGRFNPHTHLSRADVIFQPTICHTNFLEITINKSETDPFRKTANLTMAKSDSSIGTITALQDYLLQTDRWSTSQPLFQFTDGHSLTCAPLTNNLHAVLCVCGLECTLGFPQLQNSCRHNSRSSRLSRLID